ncbi:hypothetical protein ACCT32_36015, partial [Rhizobium brockwellii]|uniref:hypothetical protein n=1 Tax=Rhizobium brockwellii TaxID=3019932 RepID=UPI003F99B076
LELCDLLPHFKGAEYFRKALYLCAAFGKNWVKMRVAPRQIGSTVSTLSYSFLRVFHPKRSTD